MSHAHKHKKLVAYGQGRWPVSVSRAGEDFAVAKFNGRFAGDGGVAWVDACAYAEWRNGGGQMTQHELNCIIEMFMVGDPHPKLSCQTVETIAEVLNREARRLGFIDWPDAMDKTPPLKSHRPTPHHD